MAFEIERKFLVFPDKLPPLADGVDMVQGYIPTSNGTTVRIRIADNSGFMTIKIRTTGITRREHEFPIPLTDAREILQEMCHALMVEKTRYIIPYRGMDWELDVFKGANNGLIVAEIELDAEHQQFELPDWVATEVTHDMRYSNSNLATQPFSKWQVPLFEPGK